MTPIEILVMNGPQTMISFIKALPAYRKYLFIMVFSIYGSCKSPQKDNADPMEFPVNNATIDWKELTHKNSKNNHAAYSYEDPTASNLEDWKKYIKRVNKTVNFKRIEKYRGGLLATADNSSMFYVSSKDRLTDNAKLTQVIVKLMSEKLKCFAERKLDTRFIKAYQCRDGRVAKFMFRNDKDLSRISIHTVRDTRLEWIALESSLLHSAQSIK